MVFTGDVGNFENIHPRDKKTVGLRFAKLALRETYGKHPQEVYGPLVEKVYEEGKYVVVEFSHAEGLYFKDKQTLQFEIAGKELIFKPVKAKLKGNRVFLKSNKLEQPKFVRYAWKNAIVPNLYNKANLPASSFMVEIE